MMIHSLSVCYASLVFDELELITDSRGRKFADAFAWSYGQTRLIFDRNMICNDQRHIWALGKFAACLVQDRPFIHLDNDVLLMKKLPKWFTDGQIVAQSVDDDHWYFGDGMDEGFRVVDRAGFSELKQSGVKYNAGLLGGSDVSIIHQWAEYGMRIAERFKKSEIPDCCNGTVCSMISEQVSLGAFSRRKRVPVTTLLPPQFTEDDAYQLGYVHFIEKKRDQQWVDAAEHRFLTDFPIEYEKFLSGWAKVQAGGIK